MSIFNRFSHLTPHYFQKHFSRQLEELYVSVAVLDFALAAVMLFEPVYLYQLGYSLTQIVLFYLLVYVPYFFLAPLGGKFVARYGPERSIAISTIMYVGYYGGLILLKANPWLFWIAPIFFSLQKMFYWPAYHTDFILTSDQGERGKEFSGLWSLSTLMNILGPVAGGVVIATFGFPALFQAVILLIILSNVPLFVQPIKHVATSFSYWPSLKLPFTKQHIKTTIAYIGLGEEFVMQFIWPVFIILVVKNYVSLGGLIALATLLTAVATLSIGKMIDKNQPRRALAWGTAVTAVVWLFRPWLRLASSVFLSDTAGRIARNTTFVTMTSIGYERSLQQKKVIERSVFYEQGFAIGKSLMAALIIILSASFPTLTVSFLLASALSLLYLLF